MVDINKLKKIAKKELNKLKVWEDTVDLLAEIDGLQNVHKEAGVALEGIQKEVSGLVKERDILFQDIEDANGIAPKLIEAAEIQAADTKKKQAADSLKKSKAKIEAAEKKAAEIIADGQKKAQLFLDEIELNRDDFNESLLSAKKAQADLAKIEKALKAAKSNMRKLIGEE